MKVAESRPWLSTYKSTCKSLAKSAKRLAKSTYKLIANLNHKYLQLGGQAVQVALNTYKPRDDSSRKLRS